MWIGVLFGMLMVIISVSAGSVLFFLIGAGAIVLLLALWSEQRKKQKQEDAIEAIKEAEYRDRKWRQEQEMGHIKREQVSARLNVPVVTSDAYAEAENETSRNVNFDPETGALKWLYWEQWFKELGPWHSDSTSVEFDYKGATDIEVNESRRAIIRQVIRGQHGYAFKAWCEIDGCLKIFYAHRMHRLIDLQTGELMDPESFAQQNASWDFSEIEFWASLTEVMFQFARISGKLKPSESKQIATWISSSCKLHPDHIDRIKKKIDVVSVPVFIEAVKRLINEFGRKELVKDALELVAGADKEIDESEAKVMAALFG